MAELSGMHISQLNRNNYFYIHLVVGVAPVYCFAVALSYTNSCSKQSCKRAMLYWLLLVL